MKNTGVMGVRREPGFVCAGNRDCFRAQVLMSEFLCVLGLIVSTYTTHSGFITRAHRCRYVLCRAM